MDDTQSEIPWDTKSPPVFVTAISFPSASDLRVNIFPSLQRDWVKPVDYIFLRTHVDKSIADRTPFEVAKFFSTSQVCRRHCIIPLGRTICWQNCVCGQLWMTIKVLCGPTAGNKPFGIITSTVRNLLFVCREATLLEYTRTRIRRWANRNQPIGSDGLAREDSKNSVSRISLWMAAVS